MSRLYNFSAGPAALPTPVLERARAELLDWGGHGVSVMEVSHRSPEYLEVFAAAESALRRLLGLGDDYAVLFLQGGAQLQFAAVPLNLGGDCARFHYLNTGHWSRKAMAEAARYGEVVEVARAGGEPLDVPDMSDWQVEGDSAYLHLTPNETIDGVELRAWIPAYDGPLVADMSSTLLSAPIPVEEYGVIYAGAQKNIGPAGLTVVIVRRDLFGRAQAACPSLLNWEQQSAADSMLNTPPTWAIYIAGLVFEWLEAEGGLEVMMLRNHQKARTLYEAIDGSSFYHNNVAPRVRSWMNIPFTLADPALDSAFLAAAAERGLLYLKGHRAVGGMRASLYNAVEQRAVDALVEFMQDFERRHA
jgi:phosphoserine aminotransferase